MKGLALIDQTKCAEDLCRVLDVESRKVVQSVDGGQFEKLTHRVQELLKMISCISQSWCNEDEPRSARDDHHSAGSDPRNSVEKAIVTLEWVLSEWTKLFTRVPAAWREVDKAQTAELAISGSISEDLQRLLAWSSLPYEFCKQEYSFFALSMNSSVRYDVKPFLDQVKSDVTRNCEDVPNILKRNID